ncbi:hypothetical protein NHH82_06010 [Oxalobacteraceae bacterium OTU3REALA1]|nr:hypothetical protein NHH82_06010 [Oxalobacteraceae bacterium OTU3REALA1]
MKTRETLLLEGFVEIVPHTPSPLGICNKSATGARIFFHQERKRIAKIAHDPAYDVFVQWAQKHAELRVPRFYEHYSSGPAGVAGYATFTCMEQLEELNAVEGKIYCDWYDRIISRARKGESLTDMIDDDPLGLLDTFVALREVAMQAIQAGDHLSGFDLSKYTNLMIRVVDGMRISVYTDPLN